MANSTGSEIGIFLIADIRGYTKFTHERGDEAAARLASRFAELATDGVERHGGSLVELRGDEALAVFSSPRQSLRAAADLQARFVQETVAHPSLPLRVGIGLDAGEAVKVTNGYRGAPLNVASRLCALAAPGEVLATQGVVDLARRVEGLRFYEQGPTRLKGLDHRVAIIKVVAETANPYKGLSAFDEADALDFFGREALTEQLLARLAEKVPGQRFLAVVGPSGSGKSSVVRAGLVPALRAGALPGWTRSLVAVMVPGAHPMQELGAALRRVAGAERDDLEDLSLDPADLARVVERVLPPRAKLVLVIDQFEELFTLIEDEQVRASFLEALHAAVVEPKGRLRVVITLRADFFDRPLLYSKFGELVGARTQAVIALSPHELERAVVGPAERAGVALEPGLMSQIVADVSSEPGALPLLQYALTELFERRRGNTMTLDAYHDIGGVQGALVRRAESLYKELDQDDRDAARQLFLRLATSVNDVDITRRRVPRAEILSVLGDATAMATALDVFGAGRLLSFDRDPSTGNPTVEVAHEALLVEWSRLRGWLEASREDLRAERRLAAAAREWIDADRDPSFLLSGSRLDRFEGWRESSGLVVTPEQGEFLEASRVEWDRIRTEDEAREARERALERRTLRRTRALVAVLGMAALVAGALTLFAFNERSRAEREAHTAVARELAAASVANLEVDPERSILLAIEAVDETRSADGTVLPEAEDALHRAVTASRIELSVSGAGGSVDWSPKGVFVTEETDDKGVIDIRDASSGKTVREFNGHGMDVNSVGFSPDGSRLATTGDDGKLKLWDPANGRLLSTWSGDGAAWAPSFSADGSLLAASWEEEGIVRVVDLGTDRVVDTFNMDGAWSTSFSADGSRIAVASSALPHASVFELGTGRKAFDLTGHEFLVSMVAWSPNGRFIATAGQEAARVWDAGTGRPRFTLTAHTAPVWSVGWSRDSGRLVTGGSDGLAIVWEIEQGGGRELVRLAGQGIRRGAMAEFSPDGERVITGSGDFSTTQIWDLGLSGDAEWGNFPVEETWAVDVAFMPDSRQVVATSARDAVAVWDTPKGRRLRSIQSDPKAPVKHEFEDFDVTPDGKLIVTAGLDGTAKVWDAFGNERFTVAHTSRPRTSRHGTPGSWELTGVDWSADGSHLVTASTNGLVKILDRSGQEIRTLREAEGFGLNDAAISPDGGLVATVAFPDTGEAGGGRIKIWERDSGDVVSTIESDARAHEVVFDPTGSRIAFVTEAAAEIWGARNGKRLEALSGHSAAVVEVEFSPDGERVATGGFDGTVRLFDVQSGAQRLVLRGHEFGVFGLGFSPDGKKLASAGADGVARIWALDLDDLLEIAQDQVTRSLTDEECRQYLHLDRCTR